MQSTPEAQGRNIMKYRRRIVIAAVLALFASSGIATPSLAETGAVRVVFTKGGFIVGVGGGRGVLNFRGHNYPFRVSGMSFGATIGASTTDLVGRARNLHSPGDIAGTYSAIGAGGALAAGAGGVALQNQRGVVLELHGVKVGVELSAAIGGVTIAME
jgi:lipid-binding SYLF domain-containing protein